MPAIPDGFAIEITGEGNSERVCLKWTDIDAGEMTAVLTADEALGLSQGLLASANDIYRERRRLKALADDQLRSGTGMRLRSRGYVDKSAGRK